MIEAEFQQLVAAMKGLNIKGLLALQRLTIGRDKALLVSLKSGAVDMDDVKRIEDEAMRWSFMHEVSVFLEFQ